MRWCCWLLIAMMMGIMPGCSCSGGATTLAEMQRRAASRDRGNDEEEEAVPAAKPAPSASPKAAPTPTPSLPAVKAVSPPVPAHPLPLNTEKVAEATVAPAPETPSPMSASAMAEVAAKESTDVESDPPEPATPTPPSEPSSLNQPMPAPHAGSDPAEEIDSRLAVPTEEAQRANRRILAELYKAHYDNARTITQKQTLAKFFLREADKISGDATGQYLLLRLARDLAIQAGDVPLTLQTIDKLAAAYQIDSATEQVAALDKLATALRTKTDAELFLKSCGEVLMAAIEREDFELALRMVALSESVAKRGKMPPLLDRLAAVRKQVAEIQEAHAGVPTAQAALQADPLDPVANLEVGRYVCFYRRQWDDGLPYLAQGDDIKLKVLAQIDLSQPTTAAQQADLADQWYDLASSHEKPAIQLAIALRAAYWYQQAFHALPSGLIKSRIQKRLGEIAVVTGDASLQKFMTMSRPATAE